MIGWDAETNLRRRQSSPVQGRRNVSNFGGSVLPFVSDKANFRRANCPMGSDAFAVVTKHYEVNPLHDCDRK